MIISTFFIFYLFFYSVYIILIWIFKYITIWYAVFVMSFSVNISEWFWKCMYIEIVSVCEKIIIPWYTVNIKSYSTNNIITPISTNTNYLIYFTSNTYFNFNIFHHIIHYYSRFWLIFTPFFHILGLLTPYGMI